MRKFILYVFAFGLLLAAGAVGVFMLFLIRIDVPAVEAFGDREVVESTKLYDKSGEILLFEIYNEERRTVIPFEDIPLSVKNATITIEDTGFYLHRGISPFGIVRAFATDILRGQFLVQGGSTITQQLVKNTILTNERTITRKIKEAVLALKIERQYSKDEILNLYLNEIPYGSNAYGVEAAAETFFGKHVRDLSLAEAAYLAALPKAPSYYSPYGNHRDELDLRKNIIINRMEELQFVTRDEAERARADDIVFLPREEHGIRAPHFVMYVIDQLIERYGEEFIQKNGLKIVTSLDIQLQQYAEETVQEYAPSREEQFNATNLGLLALDPRTGEILAMVGSRDYFDIERDGNFNVTLAYRQPGSAFKPIVYATAFGKGYTPETIVFDVETEFAVPGAESYLPQNYDELFRGPVTLREALAQSINIPAVKVLYLTGITNSLRMAERLGITTLGDASRYGLTLVLGGGEVKLLDLVSVYGVFAYDGVKNSPVSILRIEKNTGETIFAHTPRPETVLDATIAHTISDILSDNEARAPAFGNASDLYFTNRDVAAKTGTTNDYRDAWIIGYTPNIAAGVWAGNNDNTPMEKRVAGFIVAPVWRNFMEKVFRTLPPESLTIPAEQPEERIKPILRGEWKGGYTYKIDRISQKLATDLTPHELIEERVIQDIHSILYWVNKNDPWGPIPDHPEKDSQFTNWEAAVRAWVEVKGLTSTYMDIPTEYDDVHTEKNKPEIIMQSPVPGNAYMRNAPLVIETVIKSTFPIQQVDYFLDNTFVGSNRNQFKTFTIDIALLETLPQKVIVRIKTYDSVGNTNEAEVPITLSSA